MQLESTKSLLANMDYLMELSRVVNEKLDQKEKFDDNLLYELAYAYTYLNNLQLQSDEVLPEEVENCKILFDAILDTALVSNELKLTEARRSDYKKLLKYRYDDLRQAGYKRIYKREETDPAKVYILKRGPYMFLLFLLMLFLASGGIPIMSSKLSDLVSSRVTGDVALMELGNMMIGLQKATSILIGAVAMIMVMSGILSFALDLIYLMFPILRDSELFSKYVSSVALGVSNGIVLTSTNISFDRVERNMSWFDALRGLGKMGLLDGDDNDYLGDLEKQLKRMRGRKFYLALANIEFLHDKYLESLEIPT